MLTFLWHTFTLFHGETEVWLANQISQKESLKLGKKNWKHQYELSVIVIVSLKVNLYELRPRRHSDSLQVINAFPAYTQTFSPSPSSSFKHGPFLSPSSSFKRISQLIIIVAQKTFSQMCQIIPVMRYHTGWYHRMLQYTHI